LIERDHQATLVAAGILAFGAFFFSVHPVAALARHHTTTTTLPAPAAPAPADDVALSGTTVTLVQDGVAGTYTTNAPTVAAFLQERNIAPAHGDKLSAAREDLVLDGMTITFTTAKTPPQNALAASAKHAARVARAQIGKHKTALRLADSVHSTLAARLIHPAHTAVVTAAVGEYMAFAQLAKRGFDSTLRAADSMLRMVATAYTASCYGCSGITALGYHAGHGIVAVDPRVIPLGTHLFIPGYGSAIAGDTGGAIKGSRIDLGFNSFSDAIQFGRREITVYVLNARAAARH
jgi:3D (Asp-Asp-Asp) domain-containing protein